MCDIKQKIYEIAKKVYENLGAGHSEFIYHRAMEIELRKEKILYDTEKRVLITYKGYTLGDERIDLFLMDEKIIIELKAVVNEPKISEIMQVKKYYRELKKVGTTCSLGILINFPQAGVKEPKTEIDYLIVKFVDE